jgi:hypothetical protein
MTTWKFRIENTGSNIHRLAHSSGSRQDFSIWKEEPDDGRISYWLSSPWLDGVTDPQELSNRLLTLKCLVDGAIFLYAPPPPRFDAIWEDAATGGSEVGGATIVFEHLRLVDAVEIETNTRVSLPEPSLADFQSIAAPQTSRGGTSLTADEIGAVVFLARHDEPTRGCLLCLGYSGVNFVSLYQCLEFMGQVSKRAALGVCKVPTTELERFQYTANNFCASGPAGRHGGPGGRSPRHTPMKETEAHELLLPVIRAFVKEREKCVDIAQQWAALPP